MMAVSHVKRIEGTIEQELCYFCKKPGHISKDCHKKKTMNCFACGESGHKIAECPYIKKRSIQKKMYGRQVSKVKKLNDDGAEKSQAIMAKGK